MNVLIFKTNEIAISTVEIFDSNFYINCVYSQKLWVDTTKILKFKSM